MDKDIIYGGFISSNIRRWIIKECLQSGSPEQFFWAIQDAVDDIADAKSKYEDENDGDYPGYWNEAYGY